MAEGGSNQQDTRIPFSFSRYFRFPNTETWNDGYIHESIVQSENFETGFGHTLQAQMHMNGSDKWGRLNFILKGKLNSPEKIELRDVTISVGVGNEAKIEPCFITSTNVQKVCEYTSCYQEKPLYKLNPFTTKADVVPIPNTFYLSYGGVTITLKGRIVTVLNNTTVTNDKSTQVPEKDEIAEFGDILTAKNVEGSCLSVLLENPQYSDVDICVNGKNFSVHKAILSTRSKGFDELLREVEPKVESNPVKIIIDDFSEDVVHEALFFMYTGTCPKVAGYMSTSLLAFADKFKMDDLKMLCETEIQSTVNETNIFRLIDLAYKNNAPILKSFCIEFFKSNSKELFGSKGWDKLKQGNPQAVISLFETMMVSNE